MPVCRAQYPQIVNPLPDHRAQLEAYPVMLEFRFPTLSCPVGFSFACPVPVEHDGNGAAERPPFTIDERE